MQDELDYWRNHAENLENTLSDTRAALDEFQISSRELEEELEKELQTTEKVCGDLKARCEQLKRESEDWKVYWYFASYSHAQCFEKDVYTELIAILVEIHRIKT
jgi:predicted  nucleic acid-binding Zn-ribbon protein